MRTRSFLAALATASVGGCSLLHSVGLAPYDVDPEAVKAAPAREEPAHVVVRHVLVAFEGSGVPGVTRTRDDAARLAQKVFADAKRGRDFGELVKLDSDDRHADGTYALANWGVATADADEVERQKMVRGFGDMAFSLEVGEIGLVEYDPATSPLGWHVMRRVK